LTARTVWKRFLFAGLDGLLDAPRSGAPRKLSDQQVESALTRTLESQPEGTTHCSTRDMARACGLSQSAIWCILSPAPPSCRDLKLSRDPLLIEKVRDIVGPVSRSPDRINVRTLGFNASTCIGWDTSKFVSAGF